MQEETRAHEEEGEETQQRVERREEGQEEGGAFMRRSMHDEAELQNLKRERLVSGCSHRMQLRVLIVSSILNRSTVSRTGDDSCGTGRNGSRA